MLKTSVHRWFIVIKPQRIKVKQFCFSIVRPRGQKEQDAREKEFALECLL